tara:strand:+ start:3255 stop:12407 length:9153 start_codon:yes stop_codon:yes gene_type:complete
MAEFQPRWNEQQVRTLTKNYDPKRTPENVKNMIAQHAQHYNLPFYEGDFEISEAIVEAGKGFAEGFTANIVSFDQPNNEYEAIFRNLGHLAGFAPGILSAPLGAAARIAPKATSLLTAAEMARKLNNKSVPMAIADFAERKAKKIARPLLESARTGSAGATQTATNFLMGSEVAKHVAQGAFHLGVASGVSSWRGGIDGMMSGFLHGGMAGGVFRAIGNYIGTGKGPGNKLARQLSGSMFMGLPETMRGATTPEQVYAYVMGAWFGGQERPWTYKKASDFVKNEFHPVYTGASGTKQSTEALRILPDPAILKEPWGKLPPEVKPVVKEMIAKSYGAIDPDSPLASAYTLLQELEKAGIKVDYDQLAEGKGFKELTAIKEKIGTPEGQEPYFVITGGNKGVEQLVSNLTNKENVANIHMLTEGQRKQYQEKKHPGFPRVVKKVELEEANEALRVANQTLKRGALKELSPGKLDQLRKNYFIVKNAEEVYLVGTVGGKRNNRVMPTASGTEWAHQMAINMKKPVYIYDQKTQRWMKWQPGVTGAFVPVANMPKPKRSMAIVGDKFMKPGTQDALTEHFTKHFKKTVEETQPIKEADRQDRDTAGSKDGQTGMPGTDIPDAGDRASRIVTKYMQDLYKDIDIPALKASKQVEHMEAIRDMIPEFINKGSTQNQSSRLVKRLEDTFGIKFKDSLTGKEYQRFKDEMRQWVSRRNSEVPTQYIDINATDNTSSLMSEATPTTMSGNRKPGFENRKVVDIVWNEIFGKDGRAHAIVDHISVETKEGWKDYTLSQFRNSGRKELGEKKYYQAISKMLKEMQAHDLYYFGGNGTNDRLVMMKHHPEVDTVSDSIIKKNFKASTLNKLRERFVKKFANKNGLSRKEAQEYFDKAFKSNVLWHLSTNGMDTNFQALKKTLGNGFIKNAVAWNKRSQIWFTDGFSADKEFYRSVEKGDGKLTDLSSEGNFKYTIVEDLPKEFAKLDHRDVSLESNKNPEHVDGAIIVRRDVLELINKDSGNSSEGITQNKSFIVSPNKEKGAFLGKYMMHDAGKDQSQLMKDSGIHFIVPESAAKQMGTREFDKVYDDLSPEHIKFSYSVNQTGDMIKPQSAKKQLFGALVSHLARSNPKEMDAAMRDIYKNFIEPSFVGTAEAKAELERFYKLPANASDKEVREALERVDFDNIGIEAMVEGLTKPGNQLFARKVYDLAFRNHRKELEEAMRDGEVNVETYESEIAKIEDFHSIQQRMLRLGSKYAQENNRPENMVGVYGHLNIADYRMQVMNNFIVKKATQPKIANSASARMRPYDEFLQNDYDNVNPRLKRLNKDDSIFFLDNAFKRMMIETGIPGIDNINLGRLWARYEKGEFNKQPEVKKQIEEIFRSAAMRVPMDSISGTQILKFQGFTGREGHGVLLHSRAMRAMGGADLDGDSAYIYMGGKKGFRKQWKDVYEANKEEFYKKERGKTVVTDNKAEKYEKILAKEWDKKDKELVDSVEGMFSPGVRMEISEAAVGGRNNLGMAAVNPKQIMGSVYNALVERGSDKFTIQTSEYNRKTKKRVKKNYEITIEPRTSKKEKDEINSLGRAMVGFASDPMDYAGLKSPNEWFNSLYNAHFKVKEVKVNGRKIQLRNFKIEDIPSYQWKDAGLYKLIHKANSAFYGRNWGEDRKWTMEERMSMTNDLHTLSEAELNTMTPKIAKMLSGLDYSDNSVKRISPEKIQELYNLWNETPAELKELLKPLGRSSFKVQAHKFIEDVRTHELYSAEGIRRALNDNQLFNRIIHDTPYAKIKEWTDRFNHKNPRIQWRAKLEALTEINNKANAFIVKDLWNMLTNSEVRRIYERMTPEERGENNSIIEAISRSVDNIKKNSYLMARARNKFIPSKDVIRPKTKEEEIMMELWEGVPESEKPLFLQKQRTAYMDQAKIDEAIFSLKQNKYKTQNQRELFDTLLLGSLNRGDLKRIEKLENMITKKGQMTKLKYDVLSKLKTEAARTSMSRVGFASKTVADNAVMNMIGKYSDLFNEVSTTRTEAALAKEGKDITVEPKKTENIKETGLPEDVLSDLEAFLTQTTGLEGVTTRGKKAAEKGLVDAKTKEYISNIVSHLKKQPNHVARDLPMIVRDLVKKDMNIMNKADWQFVSNWFDDVATGTLWQRIKGKGPTILSWRHYLQFPETINRELMKDQLILMQEKGLFITQDGTKSGLVKRPTQFMDLVQESVQRTGQEAVALGEKFTNQLEKDLLFIQDLDDMEALHTLAIRFREMPLGAKIRERIQRKESEENYFDADVYENYYKEALKATDYENSIKNKIYTITEMVDGVPKRKQRTGEEIIGKINNTYTEFFKKMHNLLTGDVIKDAKGNAVTSIPESLSPYYSRYWDPKTQKSPRIDHVKFVRDMAKRWQEGKDLPLEFGIDGLHLVARSMMIEMTKDPAKRKQYMYTEPHQTGRIDFEHYFPHMHFGRGEALESLKRYAAKLREGSLSEKEVQEKLDKLVYKHHALTGDWDFRDIDTWREWDMAQLKANKKQFEKENRISWFNPNVKSGHGLSRESHLPGWAVDASSVTSYAKGLVNAYHRQMGQIMARNYIGQFENKMRKSFGKEQTEAWTNFMKLWIQGASGAPDVIPEAILKDPKMSIQGTPFAWFADNNVKKRMNKIGDVLGITNKELPENLRGIDYNQIRHLSNLEAKFELASLLAYPKSAVNNIFGGQMHTIASVGFKTWKDARNYGELAKINPEWATKEGVEKHVIGKGVLPEFLISELGLSPEFQNVKGERFLKKLSGKLTRNPNMSEQGYMEILREAKLTEPMMRVASKFMSVPERALRRDAYMAHWLHWYRKFGGAIEDVNHPVLDRLAKKGVQATQFLYNAPNRPMFARTALGKVMTRFQLWGWNAVRFRKDALREARLKGFRGSDADRAARMMQMDLFVFALGNAFAYSLFDVAMPAPWSWFQDTGEWIFGDEKERNRAFFGQWPRNLAPLQLITPPIARLPMASMRAMLEDDWSRVSDYYIHTMYPFGRIGRDFIAKNNLIDNPQGIIDKWTGIPLQQFKKERKKVKEGTSYKVKTPGAFY